MDFNERAAIESFKETVAFSRLLILMLFAANVAAYMQDGGMYAAFGMLAAIACTAAAWVAQSCDAAGGPADTFFFGRVASIVCGSVSAILFLLGS